MVRVHHLLYLALLLAWAAPRALPAQEVEHVFVVVIDGLRAAEGFEDPDHLLVGPLIDDLAPQGSLLTYMEVRGQTLTLPAHQVFVTGTYADCGNTWAYEDRLYVAPRVPTLFDLYHRHTGEPIERGWVVSNTPLVGHDCEHTLMPGYGLERSAMSVVDFSYTESDDWVWDQVESVLAGQEVDLMLVNLHEVDRMGHSQDWDGYLDKAHLASVAVAQFWDRLQADPVYAGTTALFVTTDHGRHRDDVENGFIGHGCYCDGCRQIFLLALGPGIRQGYIDAEAFSFLDLAPTIAHLLDIPFPFHRGRVLTEILEDGDSVDPGPGGSFLPRAAVSGGLRVRAYEFQDTSLVDNQGAHQVIVETSDDGGESWQTTPMGGELAVQRSPVTWTDGEVILAGWQEYTVKGEEWYLRLMRLGAESTEWEDVFHEPMAGSSTPIASTLLLDTGSDLYLLESNPRTEVLRTWVSEDRGYSWSENLAVAPIRRHFPRDTSVVDTGEGWVVAYSANTAFEPSEDDPNENTEVFWQRSVDQGQTWTLEQRLIEDVAPSIQPTLAADHTGLLHLVWADRASGAFELLHAESADHGASFSTPVPLTFDSFGSWEPSIASDGERIYVAWTEFDALDQSSIRVAAIEDGALVEERVLGEPGVLARTPVLTPLGDCTASVSWSQSDLQGPWEVVHEQVVTSGWPATTASGRVEPAELTVNGGAQTLTVTFDLEVGEFDRGFDRIELYLPPPVAPDGELIVQVDGSDLEGATTAVEPKVWFDAAELVGHDGAEVLLQIDVLPGPLSEEPQPLHVLLHRGDEPCTTEVTGDLDIHATSPGDDDDDTVFVPGGDGCDCRIAQPGATGFGGFVVLWIVAALLRRRRAVQGRRAESPPAS